jgi:predicted O-methyltransferase YrrM
MDEYPNWFASDGINNFEHFLAKFKDKPIRALQIGAYTGDASVWIATNILTHPESVLVDVDTWEGSDEAAHKHMDWNNVEDVYDEKTKFWRDANKIVKCKSTSDDFFSNNKNDYDFIYVDGDHTSYGVIKDAVNSYEVLKVDGMMGFDDYQWTGGVNELDRPRKAIDAFLGIYSDRISLLLLGYQCWVKKLK